MCLIVIKKKGVQIPDRQAVNNANINNPDGIGIAYWKNGSDRVYIKKDFDLASEFNDWLEKNIAVDDVCLIHFRYATSGLKDKGNRHPFPVVRNRTLYRKTELETDLAVVHNGVLSQHSGHKKYSDTQLFISDILSQEVIKNNLTDKTIQTILTDYIGSDKLAFLTAQGEIITLGEYSLHKGLLMSNDGYKARDYNYLTGYHFTDKHSRDIPCEICEGYKKVRVWQDADTQEEYYLCKKCRKRLVKGEKIENMLDEIYGYGSQDSEPVCESCNQALINNEWQNTDYGVLCNSCYKELLKTNNWDEETNKLWKR